MTRPVRLAVRAIILHSDRLLMVNAWPTGKSDLLCAPGGGVHPHQSLPENLAREVYEETGATIRVGPVVMINEFHDPHGPFHQVDIYFRCELTGDLPETWTDPEGVVTERHWLTRDEISGRRVKPDSLADVAWEGSALGAAYDPLEPILR